MTWNSPDDENITTKPPVRQADDKQPHALTQGAKDFHKTEV
jgi:hypothetical protein